MSMRKEVPLWAKMPTRWIHNHGLNAFTNRDPDSGELSTVVQNESIGALKLYMALCIRADFNTGMVKTTYDKLVELTGMSRAVIARSLDGLERRKLIRREVKSLREGSLIFIEGWLEEGSYAQLPKRWMYDGNQGRKLLKFREFTFSRVSLLALKVYLTLLAVRDRNKNSLAVISYGQIALKAGIGRHLVADAITELYRLELISFRQGSFHADEESSWDRTNRYLIKGLNISWTALSTELPPIQSAKKARPSKSEIGAAVNFVADRS